MEVRVCIYVYLYAYIFYFGENWRLQNPLSAFEIWYTYSVEWGHFFTNLIFGT